MKYIVQAEQNILDALARLSPNSSRNTLRSWIKEGRVLIDDKTAVNTSIQVIEGQIVTVSQRKKMVRPGLPIVYQDDDLVIVDKPAGLLSVATAFEKGETAHALLKVHFRPRKVFVVHRLDQDTSGVMVFALNETVCNQLKDRFEVHDIERAYTAIVEGRMTESSGTWKSYQLEDKQYRVHETDDPGKGRLAITHFKTLASSRRYSWLELQLETGRKNQIRVHCQSADHPIAGDKKYGAKTHPIKRLCLHAHLLAFQHPITKKMMRFTSPPPDEFYRLVPPFSDS